MKTVRLLTFIAAFIQAATALAQFNAGSNGSFGPLNVTANTTLAIPDDGIFHCTTISVAAGKTLKFTKNAQNTPVYLLATGDVSVAGTIDVSGSDGTASAGGAGGPGGFDGGNPGFGTDTPPSSGGGPGGGKGGDNTTNGSAAVGSGSYGGVSTIVRPKNGSVYGTRLLVPIVGGSGGGGMNGNPGFGGGGGGGAILIASNTRITVSGYIQAAGGNTLNASEGSGGAIRLVSPRVDGAGSLAAFGSNRAGVGRTRIDTLDRSGLSVGADVVSAAMFVFPSPLPKLSVISAAGTAITEGSTTPVNLFLNSGTSPNQTIVVRARDFGGAVPIRVSLVPDSGDAIPYDAMIDNTVNPADTTVNVTIPVNQKVRVEVYTR